MRLLRSRQRCRLPSLTAFMLTPACLAGWKRIPWSLCGPRTFVTRWCLSERSVGNPILMDSSHACLLITGSNMSGKSTFLRAVGVNFLLARAGARAMAKTFEAKNCAVRTCLRITDSITDQISSFYAEVQELKAILDQAQESSTQPDQPVLIYLIDEIFRGTNNRERLQGSRAYIEAMLGMKRASGLIATHDLELAELSRVNSRLENLHFHETIEGERCLLTIGSPKARRPRPMLSKSCDLRAFR